MMERRYYGNTAAGEEITLEQDDQLTGGNEVQQRLLKHNFGLRKQKNVGLSPKNQSSWYYLV